jgi:Zn ribbon nucleic-acid-binding protein
MARTTSLSASQLVAAVDAGTSANAAEQGRTLLALVLPDPSDERLDATALEVRDAWLLALRCSTFGSTLKARVVCPQCHTQLALEIPRESIPLPEPQAERLSGPPMRISHGELVIEARSPDGAALERAARCPDVASARASLVASCVTVLSPSGESIDAESLDVETLEQVGEAIAEAEPGVEVGLGVTCVSCGHIWEPILDILLFLWRELSTTGVQVLDEVHELASAYGWSEEEILGLSSRRRRQYVERLTRA